MPLCGEGCRPEAGGKTRHAVAYSLQLTVYWIYVTEFTTQSTKQARYGCASMNASEHSMSQEALFRAVKLAGQAHVLRWWDELDADHRENLLEQLHRLGFAEIRSLSERVREGGFAKTPDGEVRLPEYIRLPRTDDEELERESARRTGERLIAGGKVAALTVAGGQGTRLGFDGPKGAFPIGPVSSKSLFQILAERIVAARRRYHGQVPWYVMTSDATDAATRRYFDEHGYFGLPSEDVRFFRQGMMPALDRDFKLVLTAKDQILFSPDGHGGAFPALRDSGMLDDMQRRGVEEISYFQVDNPLLPAVDPIFIGFHSLSEAQMSSKAMWKRDPEEPIGAFVKVNGRLIVKEYSDLTREQLFERNEEGLLVYGLGSPAIHMIRADFVRRQTRSGRRLPFHLAEKSAAYLDAAGRPVEAEGKNVYKFETFIFDALLEAERSPVLEVVREHEFSPVKNRTGADSPETSGADMTMLYAEWLTRAGIHVPRDEAGNPRHPIEISPLYALDVEELVQRVPRDLKVDGPLCLEGEGGT